MRLSDFGPGLLLAATGIGVGDMIVTLLRLNNSSRLPREARNGVLVTRPGGVVAPVRLPDL